MTTLLRTPIISLLAAGWLAVTPVLASAQRQITRLGAADRVFVDGFDKIGAVRELADESLIVLDINDQQLYLIDAGWEDVRRVGTKGQGPLEYSSPTRIFGKPDGGTWLVDRTGPRILDIGDKGNILGTVSASPWDRCAGVRPQVLLRMRAVDDAGNMYTEAEPVAATSSGSLQITDQSAIERWTSPCVRDTVALIDHRLGKNGILVGSSVVGRIGTRPPPFPTYTTWAAAPDGRVAIVRHSPYRVEIVSAQGERVLGPVVQLTPVRVSEAHKENWRIENSAPQPVTVITRAAPTETQNTMRSRPVNEPDRWPETLPPFIPGREMFSSNGMLWVQRHTAANAPDLFDVFDQRGVPVSLVELPAGRRLVGFGKSSVYLAVEDEDGLQIVERYRQ